MPVTDRTPRAARRDATRNRARLLEAARTLFTRHGADVALEEIARAAQVSRTTLYRNFTSREGLALVLAHEGLDRVERRADAVREDALGLLVVVDLVLALQFDGLFVSALLPRGDASYVEVAARTQDVLRPLVERAGATGTLRPGVDLEDVLLALQGGDVLVTEPDPAVRADRHRRVRRLLLHGLFEDGAVADHERSARAGRPDADPPGGGDR